MTEIPSPPRIVAEEPPMVARSCSAMLRALQHHAHEDEERHRDQHLVDHVAGVAAGQRAQVRHVEHAELHGDDGEEKRGARQREGHREAQHQKADHAEEHQAARISPRRTGSMRAYSVSYL
jgi:hypothetical protein